MGSFFKQTWLVLVLAVGFGVGLAAVERSLDPRIQANAAAKLQRAAFEVTGVSPEAATADDWKFPGMDKDDKVFRVWSTADHELVGWAVRAKTKKAYSGDLSLMIGLSADGQTITGLQILESNETPGLGDRIKEEAFRKTQFAGKNADTAGRPLKVVKGQASGPADVEAITGATISSSAVVNTVNEKLAQVQAAIARAVRE